MSNRPSRVAFVGNIPYGVPEEQLTNIFSEVGPVISFRLVFDRETGKPKGYGFCEYHDVETAMCAVRNLNNYDINGRQLRVAFAENELSEQRDRNESRSESRNERSSDHHHHASSGRDQRQRHESPASASAAATPSVEMINTALSSMSSTQLLEVLTQMKGLIQSNPDEARQILGSNPQLSYALFQALLMMGLVDTNIVMKLTQNFQPQSAPTAAPPIPPQILKGLEGIPEQQRTLLLQILQMTPEQINALPPDQRQHVLTIKSQLLAGHQ